MQGWGNYYKENRSNEWTKPAKTLMNFESKSNGVLMLGTNIIVTVGISHILLTLDLAALSRRWGPKDIGIIRKHFKIGLNRKRKRKGNQRILRPVRDGLM